MYVVVHDQLINLVGFACKKTKIRSLMYSTCPNYYAGMAI